MSDLLVRRAIQRAIDDALHPKGMSVHSGRAVVGADKLLYMLKAYDALAAECARLKVAWDAAYEQAMQNGAAANEAKARLAEAERTLPCGCHHSLDDSYGGCILHTALRCHEEMETESEKREARLEEAERLLLKFHTAGPAGITALIDEVPAFLGITDSAIEAQERATDREEPAHE